MRIFIHDYSGHPFQVQLSRTLAKRGHIVRHVFCASFQSPRGNLVRLPHDPDGLEIHAVKLDTAFLKDTFFRRRNQEIAIGKLIAAKIVEFSPDIVISSNAPLDTQRSILREAQRQGAKFVFWLQDIYSEAIQRILSKKMPGLGALVGMFYHSLEYRMLRNSDQIVSISDDFVGILEKHGIDRGKVKVIENWAPLEEIVPVERDNDWVRENMPHKGLRIVYSGTLGYKHNPQLLLDLARIIDGHVYVFSEGRAAEGLKTAALEQKIDNLHVGGWVPFANLASMLSGADMFVAVIEKDAGIFSVPSKVLTYLCIGRPIIGFIPDGNLARTIILREQAGIVGDPDKFIELTPQILELISDASRREKMGQSARHYAERTFDVEIIADKFEAILVQLL